MITVGKQVTRQSLVGQEGVNLIERVALDMKSLWHPTVAGDIGIDGQLELCDRTTGESLHLLIAVQSRATAGRFTAESEHTLEYVCDQRDLDYWMRGNLPVILIRSRPSTREAYWVSIKDHFKEPVRRLSRKVIFEKNTDRFEASCYDRLIRVAVPSSRGLYLAPTPNRERLITNLLPVTSYGDRIYVAETEYRDPKDLWDDFSRRGLRPGREWVLRNKRILSFINLTDHAWRGVCDRGTVEDFDSSEWADAADPERQSEFVQLLKWSLRCKLGPDIRWNGELDLFHFPPRWETVTGSSKSELVGYSASYEALTRTGKRGVFEVYRRVDGSVRYCRHYAFEGQFRRYDGQWFLAITPTYHFTFDGQRQDRYSDAHLSGIKRQERNPAVLAALRLWAQLIAREDLERPRYPYLSFANLLELEVDGGIEDSDWEKREEAPEAKVLAAAENQLHFETEQ